MFFIIKQMLKQIFSINNMYIQYNQKYNHSDNEQWLFIFKLYKLQF